MDLGHQRLEKSHSPTGQASWCFFSAISQSESKSLACEHPLWLEATILWKFLSTPRLAIPLGDARSLRCMGLGGFFCPVR
jgi:hypothetical protein